MVRPTRQNRRDMKTFLQHVAEDLIRKYGNDLSGITVVFPNKRASLFLNQALVSLSENPIWSPSYLTISELFRMHSIYEDVDPIKAVCELHASYIAITGSNESLDRFYGWGQMLLADFDDIDKNMADASRVFSNIRDLHDYDDLSYLTDAQKDILKRFFANFNDRDSELQRRFLNIWNKLYDIYSDFHKRLDSQKLAYEGMLYRDAVSRPVETMDNTTYVFVGFNVLHKVEQNMFDILKEYGRARFYWDFDLFYLNSNEAGEYIRRYIDKYPNELDSDDHGIYDCMGKKKNITIGSAQSENIQARYVTSWLTENDRWKDGNRTAIVLCDENLLQTVIHSIPQEVASLNVTTGFPLKRTPAASLVNTLLTLVIQGYSAPRKGFRMRYVNKVLRHPYAKYISEETMMLYDKLRTDRYFYVSSNHLCIDEGTTMLFGTLEKVVGSEDNTELVRWLMTVVRHIAMKADSEDADHQFFQESLFRIYTVLSRLDGLIASGDLVVDKQTLHHFITQHVSATSIPFHGEPAVGVQIMGVLETRNLDFDHLLILSCNEGNMPKGVNDSSFIPHSIRKAYGLTTVDNKVAVYSYYFHRMIQRSKDVTILYNSSTSAARTGEMSRFMLQLLVETNSPIRRIALCSGQEINPHSPKPIPCNEKIRKRLDSIKYLSPTAITTFMRCPLMFFYNYIVGIKEDCIIDDDDIDSRMFGLIFHNAAQTIYEEYLPQIITSGKPVEMLLKGRKGIEEAVDKAMAAELFNRTPAKTWLPTLNGLQVINRDVIIRYLRKLLNFDLKNLPVNILNHECSSYMNINVKIGDRKRTVSVGGRIDRLDIIGMGTPEMRMRVVDYKTGTKEAGKIKNIDDLFNPDYIQERHTDYMIQAMLYSYIVERDRKLNPDSLPVSPALLFIQKAGGENYSPILSIDGKEIKDFAEEYGEEFEEGLTKVIASILEGESFIPRCDSKKASYCPYRGICGVCH